MAILSINFWINECKKIKKGVGGWQSNMIMRNRRGSGQHVRKIQILVFSVVTDLKCVLPVMQDMTGPYEPREVRMKSMPNSVSSPLYLQLREEAQPEFSSVTALGSPWLAASLMGQCEQNSQLDGSLVSLVARTLVGWPGPGLV